VTALPDPDYLAFPFRVDSSGPRTSRRAAHVREQIEQVLFTGPRERVFRDFGAGLRDLVMEPNASALAELTRKRLLSSLAEALRGEVDPKTLEVEVTAEEAKLMVTIRYVLATIGETDSVRFDVGTES